MSLLDRLPTSSDPADPDALFAAVSEWTAEQGIELYPAQEEALIEIVTGANVIVATPTGSGKSLIAVGAHFAALATGRRTFYTAPTKALVSEKFFALCGIFGADRVAMLTGDVSVNPEAPLVCCTAEILANLALRGGESADVGQVVMDEFHYYADPDRGWAWQVPLLELPQAQFVLLSATLGDVSRFEEDLTARTGRSTTTVAGAERPVPLFFSFELKTLHETVEELLYTKQAPIYVVHPTQAGAAEHASALMSINMCTREEKERIAEALGDFRFAAGFGRILSRLVRHGVGVHHAGMLPKYRRLVETLTQAGLLKVVCGTDTLGVGINVPIRTVVITSLSKYDGTKVRLLSVREFHQIAGRAGRAGYDTAGRVVVLAPEHVIENEKALAKAGDDAKKRRKVVRRKPPEGMVSWNAPTYERLVSGEPEPLQSSFRMSNAMLLNLLARPGDVCAALEAMIARTHGTPELRERLQTEANEILESLQSAGIVERLEPGDPSGRTLQLTVELQPDFALNQPLSPFALAAVELLDRTSPTYALDVVSVIEATLENPRQVLAAQRNRARGEAVAQMKAEGLEYEARMELLEDVTYPRPLEELLEGAFAIYAEGHPWVADFELAPKSVVREMYEQAMTFADYAGFYGLARSEGVLLRYLADASRALRQTVPEEARTEELEDLLVWLAELVRQVDSSLIDEWERLMHPDAVVVETSVLEQKPPPVTANKRAFRVLVRNALFRRVELAARRRWAALGELDESSGFGAESWRNALEPYFADFDEIGTGPDARGPGLLIVDERADRWVVRQILDDPAGDHDWGFSAEVDLAASDEAGTAVVRVTAINRL